MKPEKVLTLLVNQYKARHKCLPKQIVIHPVAVAALALKRSIAPTWSGIPVICREIEPKNPANSETLGITVVDGVLRGFDL